MPNQIYKIARVTDVQIGHALAKLAEEFGEFTAGFNVMQQSLGQVRFPGQELPAWQQVLNLDGELVDHFSANPGNITVTYYRGGQTGDPVQKSPVLDDLFVDLNGLDERRMEVASRVLAVFRPVSTKVGTASDAIAAQQAIQESTFARLQKQLEDLFAQTVQVRKELDESVRAKTSELETAYAVKQQEADAEVGRRQSKLEEQEELLERRAAELDDSDNTFARRKIRDGMLDDVTERVKNFDVSEATHDARTPVLRGMYTLILLFFGLLSWTGWELIQVRADQSAAMRIVADIKSPALPSPAASASTAKSADSGLGMTLMHDASTERIALWVRLSFLTLGLVAALIYYIRWQARWAEQFASIEQSLKQFHLDVNRANWVVETCLEWRKETDSLIPTPLIESLTRGLFIKDDPTPLTLHPADELASALIGSASKVSLAVGENKLDFDKPGKTIPKTVSANKAA